MSWPSNLTIEQAKAYFEGPKCVPQPADLKAQGDCQDAEDHYDTLFEKERGGCDPTDNNIRYCGTTMWFALPLVFMLLSLFFIFGAKGDLQKGATGYFALTSIGTIIYYMIVLLGSGNSARSCVNSVWVPIMVIGVALLFIMGLSIEQADRGTLVTFVSVFLVIVALVTMNYYASILNRKDVDKKKEIKMAGVFQTITGFIFAIFALTQIDNSKWVGYILSALLYTTMTMYPTMYLGYELLGQTIPALSIFVVVFLLVVGILTGKRAITKGVERGIATST